ncbi:hypothetical protein AB1L30_05275 [Bremerella sp. JC817]|uniref:hypothetical protein n=1 Tax=Bremerella sp. JC817 TaxID=3231756 RepID=UPI003458A3EA
MHQIPWDTFRDTLFRQLGLKLKDVDQLIHDVEQSDQFRWQRVEDFESQSDAELIAQLHWLPVGDLLVINDNSYREPGGPFVVEPQETLVQFSERYQQAHDGEYLFNGDVLIFHWAYRYVGIFHHEGVLSEAIVSPPSAAE